MRLLKIIALVSAGFLFLTLPSCQKSNLSKIQGVWEFINFDHMSNNPEFFFTWEFDAGEVVVKRYDLTNNNPVPQIVNLGSYNEKTNFLNASIEIYDLRDPNDTYIQEGEWIIADIDNENLRLDKIEEGHGHVIREFKRSGS